MNILKRLAHMLLVAGIAIIANLSMSDADNSDNRADQARPSWDRLAVGTPARILPDAYDHSKYVCDAPGSNGTREMNGCRRHPELSRIVITSKVMREPAPAVGYPIEVVGVKSTLGSWSGYMPVVDIEPQVPFPLAMRTDDDSSATSEYRAPRLQDSPNERNPHDPGAPVGVQIGHVPVLLIDFRQVVDGEVAFAPANVRILGGPLRGRTGWINSSNLEFGNGFHIGCFC